MWPLNDVREKGRNGEGRERERERERGREGDRGGERATYLLHEMVGWGTPDAKQLKDMDWPTSRAALSGGMVITGGTVYIKNDRLYHEHQLYIMQLYSYQYEQKLYCTCNAKRFSPRMLTMALSLCRLPTSVAVTLQAYSPAS